MGIIKLFWGYNMTIKALDFNPALQEAVEELDCLKFAKLLAIRIYNINTKFRSTQ